MSTQTLQSAQTYDGANPEGIVTGGPGAVLTSTDKTKAWVKRVGSGTTGWIPYVLRTAAFDAPGSLRIVTAAGGAPVEFVRLADLGTSENDQRAADLEWGGSVSFTYDASVRKYHAYVTLLTDAAVVLASTGRQAGDVLEIQLEPAATAPQARVLTVAGADNPAVVHWAVRDWPRPDVGVFVFDGSTWVFTNVRPAPTNNASTIETHIEFPLWWDIGRGRDITVEIGEFTVQQETRLLVICTDVAAAETRRDAAEDFRITLPPGARVGVRIVLTVVPSNAVGSTIPSPADLIYAVYSVSTAGVAIAQFGVPDVDPGLDHAQITADWNGTAWVLVGTVVYPSNP